MDKSNIIGRSKEFKDAFKEKCAAVEQEKAELSKPVKHKRAKTITIVEQRRVEREIEVEFPVYSKTEVWTEDERNSSYYKWDGEILTEITRSEDIWEGSRSYKITTRPMFGLSNIGEAVYLGKSSNKSTADEYYSAYRHAMDFLEDML